MMDRSLYFEQVLIHIYICIRHEIGWSLLLDMLTQRGLHWKIVEKRKELSYVKTDIDLLSGYLVGPISRIVAFAR